MTSYVLDRSERIINSPSVLFCGNGQPVEADSRLHGAISLAVFHRYLEPGTVYANRSYLRNRLPPHFTGRPIAAIGRQEVGNRFARLRATPVAADRSLPVLSVIVREAGLHACMGFQTPRSSLVPRRLTVCRRRL